MQAVSDTILSLLEDLAGDIDRFDFIFNTIPAMVLDSVLLEAAKQEAVIVDIASSPEAWISKPADASVFLPNYVLAAGRLRPHVLG